MTRENGHFLLSPTFPLSLAMYQRIKLLETQNAQKVTFFSFFVKLLFHSIFSRWFFLAVIPLTIHALNLCPPDEIPLPFVKKTGHNQNKKYTHKHTEIICLVMINSKIPHRIVQIFFIPP